MMGRWAITRCMLDIRRLLVIGLALAWTVICTSGCRPDKDEQKARATKQLEALPYLNWVPTDEKTRDADGVAFAALPRGFYLRAAFTERVVRARFGLDR